MKHIKDLEGIELSSLGMDEEGGAIVERAVEEFDPKTSSFAIVGYQTRIFPARQIGDVSAMPEHAMSLQDGVPEFNSWKPEGWEGGA